MSEPRRTVSQIQQSYSELCMRAGHLQYSIYALSLDLDLVNEQLKDLNLEGAASQKAEAEAKAAEASNVVSIKAEAGELSS